MAQDGLLGKEVTQGGEMNDKTFEMVEAEVKKEWAGVGAWRIKIGKNRDCLILARLGDETTQAAIRFDNNEKDAFLVAEFIEGIEEEK